MGLSRQLCALFLLLFISMLMGLSHLWGWNRSLLGQTRENLVLFSIVQTERILNLSEPERSLVLNALDPSNPRYQNASAPIFEEVAHDSVDPMSHGSDADRFRPHFTTPLFDLQAHRAERLSILDQDPVSETTQQDLITLTEEARTSSSSTSLSADVERSAKTNLQLQRSHAIHTPQDLRLESISNVKSNHVKSKEEESYKKSEASSPINSQNSISTGYTDPNFDIPPTAEDADFKVAAANLSRYWIEKDKPYWVLDLVFAPSREQHTLFFPMTGKITLTQTRQGHLKIIKLQIIRPAHSVLAKIPNLHVGASHFLRGTSETPAHELHQPSPSLQ